MAQIYGQKKWTLFPPEETPKLYPTRIPYEESSVFSQVNIDNPDLSRFPAFASAVRYEVIIIILIIIIIIIIITITIIYNDNNDNGIFNRWLFPVKLH